MNEAVTERAKNLLSGEQRAAYGVIVSFQADDGKRITGHRTGKVREGIRSLCDAALALGPSYRITAISTPSTIYADVRGTRKELQGNGFLTIEERGRESD